MAKKNRFNNQKDLINNKPIEKYIEEKIYFNFKKTTFDEEFINFGDVEDVVKNVKKLLEGTLEELKKEDKISHMHDIKVNLKRGSLLFEILIPASIPYITINSNLIFEFLNFHIKNLKLNYDESNFQSIKSNPRFNNKNINGSVYNIVNNYHYNCSICDSSQNKKIDFENEEENENIKENLRNLVSKEKFVKDEYHIGKLIMAHKRKNSYDKFEFKHSNNSVKIKFEHLGESEKIELFSKEELLIYGETYYEGDEIKQIIVKNVIPQQESNLKRYLN